jgi:SAM-dependent methyltransferase
LDPAFVSLVRCPVCRTDTVGSDYRALRCSRCDRRFPLTEPGYYDLLSPIGHGEPTASSPTQRFMESELVARVYERLWRPFFLRVLAGRGAGANAGGFGGEFFIHKNALGMDDRGGPWLDLSCGPGLFTRAMAGAAPGASVVGLDISKAMLEVAARRMSGYDNVTLVRSDAQDLPFADERFDGINNAGALHIYDDPDAAFRGIFRVLRPGGVFVASTFAESANPVSRAASRIAGVRRFDPAELRAWLSRVGFADYEEIRIAEAVIFKARRP